MVTLEALEAFGGVNRHQFQSVLDAEAARRSLAEFLRLCWHFHHPRQALQWNWHLDAIVDHLAAVVRRDIKRLIINVPPRTLKSYLVSVAFPAWVWTFDPAHQFLSTSAAQKVVTRDSNFHRRLVCSKWYRDLFHPDWTMTPGENAVGYFSNTAMGHRISLTRGESITGVGADTILVDDYLDAREAHSDKKALSGHTQSYEEGPATRLNDENDGAIVAVMQRLHERDLTGYLLDQGDWELLCLPAEYEGARSTTTLGWKDPRTQEGELLFPARLSAKILAQKKRALGSRGYAGQFQQNPGTEGGTLFKEGWLNYWIPGSLPEFEYTITSWDCTFRKTDDSDFVVGQAWGVVGGDRYLLEQYREKAGLTDTLRAIREMARRVSKCRAHVVELKANGRKVIATLQREISALSGYDPQGSSKEERANAVLPTFEAGNIYIPHPDHKPWVRESWKPEILAFPQARRDDQVDATTQALLWIMENGPAKPWISVL